MGKSIRSKREKKLRTIKREKLAPREQILLAQKAAIVDIIRGLPVDEGKIPQLPEDQNAPKRFQHTRDGKPIMAKSLLQRFGHLAKANSCVNKFNTLEALSERYDKVPMVKHETNSAAASSSSSSSKSAGKMLPGSLLKKALPGLLTRRVTGTAAVRRGRDRTEKVVTSSTPVKQEPKQEDDEMKDDSGEHQPIEVEDDDKDDDEIRYVDYGKPAHERRSRSALGRRRSKAKGKGNFMNWHNMAASS